MKKLVFLLVCTIFLSSYANSQFQLGQTLSGSYSYNYTNEYNNTDASFDGSVFVAGNPLKKEFKVFELEGNAWRQKGQTISTEDLLSVLISEDGNTIVANERYRIGIYRWDGIQWIDSKSPELNERVRFIEGVSASGDCNRICINYLDNINNLGIYEVFELEVDRWKTLGNNITIENPSIHWWGKIIELSGDGSTLLTGYIDDETFRYDMIKVFNYSGTEWVQEKETFHVYNSPYSENDISVSHDGTIIAFSDFYQFRVLRWDGQNWVPKGGFIPMANQPEGKIEIDGLGNRLAISEPMYSADTFFVGRVALFEYDGQNWSFLGPAHEGGRVWDQLGTSLSLSADGKVMVAASYPVPDTLQSYIKAFKYDGVPYSPVSFISSIQDSCDYERIAIRHHYNIELSNGQTHNYFLDGSSDFLLPIGDSVIIRPIAPQHYQSIPSISIIDSITLEIYKAKPGNHIKDTFCLIPNDTSTVDVRIDIVIPQSARPGFDIPVILKYTNVGTKTVSGNIQFYFDGQYQTIKNSNPLSDFQDQNLVRWNYVDLLPLESRQIEMIIELNSPMSTPPLKGGDRLMYSAQIVPIVGDINPQDNETEATIEVVNAFDPNDKRCMQGDTIRPESVGRPLTYVIRFENIGTAEAIDVRIRDIIDTSMLDISTFEMISASHDGYIVQISDGNIIDFTFKDIYLPFDDENNDGYVAFNIHTKKDLKVGDAILNDASIYFDYNYPVITNEAITLVADKATGTTNIQPQVELKAQPNPVRDFTRVSASASILRMDLFDPSGRHLRQEVYTRSDEKTRDFNTSGLTPGIYWLRVTTEKGTGAIYLIKE